MVMPASEAQSLPASAQMDPAVSVLHLALFAFRRLQSFPGMHIVDGWNARTSTMHCKCGIWSSCMASAPLTGGATHK